MRKKCLLTLLLFVSAFFIAVPDITDAATGNGSDTVKVFVKMRDSQPGVRGGALAARSSRNSMKDIASVVAGKTGGNVTHTYESVGAVAVEVTRDEFLELMNDPDVEYVEEVMVAHIFLDDSVPLINADDAWLVNYTGVNITGSSTSVCVVDTGVDTDHPALADKIVAQRCFCTISDYGNGGCCLNGTAENESAEDDEGHGTHVAGIVAASGGISGVAKGANIVAVKVMNATGYGDFSDILDGIDWCITNAETYNITAISMSLGTGFYTDTYCDNEDGSESTRDMVNQATYKNISVVVATGNEYHTDGISFPACLYNTTKVSATDKSDNIPSYANRGGSFTDILLAPGSSIYSAQMNGGYVTLSGTSMATPHVSGAVALLTQAYRLKHGYLPTAAYVKNVLNGTGVQIDDTPSGKTYSRINVYRAVIEVIRPRVMAAYNNATGDNSTETSSYEGETVLFNVSTDQDVEYRWTMNGSDQGHSPDFTWHTNRTDGGSWNITVFVNNTNGSDSHTWLVDVFERPFAVYPDTGHMSNNMSITFSYYPNDGAVSGCALFTNESGWAADEWNGTAVALGEVNNITHLFASDGDYRWNMMCNDTGGDAAHAQFNRTIVVDSSPPAVAIYEPSGNYSAYPLLNFSVTEAHPDSCMYSVNGGTNASVTCGGVVSLSGIAEGENNVTVCANDTLGNMNCTGTEFLYDPTGPVIFVRSPGNRTYASGVIFANVSTSEVSGSCVLDYGDGNITMNGTGQSFNATVAVDDGVYGLAVFCNDTLGNYGMNDSVYFAVDTVLPVVEVIAPQYAVYNEDPVYANVSVDGAQWCGLSVNGGANQSMENMSAIPAYEFGMNVSGLDEGWNNLTVSCNDSAGNMNSTAVEFFVNTDYPRVGLISPDDGGTSDELAVFNYSVNGSFVDECAIYGNFSGTWAENETNGTEVVPGVNLSAATYLDDGTYLWTAGCRDIGGKIYFAAENRTVVIDTSAPNISIAYPVNNTTVYGYREMTTANITTDEFAYCRYNMTNESFDFENDGTIMNSSDGRAHYAMMNVSDGGNYTIYYRCRDIYGHEGEVPVMHGFVFVIDCADSDGDGYGAGLGCLGTDCDDSNQGIYTGCTTSTSSSGSTRSSGSGGGIVTGLAVANVNESDDEFDEPENMTDVEAGINSTDDADVANMTADGRNGTERERIMAEIMMMVEDIEKMVENGTISAEDARVLNSTVSDIMALIEAEDFQNAELMARELRESMDAVMADDAEDETGTYVMIGLLTLVTILCGEMVLRRALGNFKKRKMVKGYVKMCMDRGFDEMSIGGKLRESGMNNAYVDEIVEEVKADEDNKG